MEELRDVSSEQLEHFLYDARDLHGKFGNPGKPTLAKLLEPINGNPNPKRITEIIDLFETMYFMNLEEMVQILENEIERRKSSMVDKM